MKWSWKIGRPFGIDTEVHASFLLLLLWVVFGAFSDGGTLAAAAYSVAFLVGVFASVVLHELGHALTARGFGVRTRRILLLPIGGMAQLEGMPRRPKAELLVALAGPAVSFLVAAVLSLATTLLAAVPGFTGSLAGVFMASLMWANLMLGLFNLVPAFPMDGGRALRAYLATRMPRLRATEIAVQVGKVAAVGLGLFGLFANPWLVVIAAFIWFAAGAELRALRQEERLSGFFSGGVDVDLLDPRSPGRSSGPSSHGMHEVVVEPDGRGGRRAFILWQRDPRRRL
jgi:Zn-dependent protease